MKDLTPEEQAIDLLFSFNAKVSMQQPYDHDLHMKKAKQSALICVEEIEKALGLFSKAKTTKMLNDKKYWGEVKKHIEKTY